jgi:hypothetical protein
MRVNTAKSQTGTKKKRRRKKGGIITSDYVKPKEVMKSYSILDKKRVHLLTKQ